MLWADAGAGGNGGKLNLITKSLKLPLPLTMLEFESKYLNIQIFQYFKINQIREGFKKKSEKVWSFAKPPSDPRYGHFSGQKNGPPFFF